MNEATTTPREIPVLDTRGTSEVDLARIAAIIDCEGNIQLRICQAQITVGNKQVRLLEWCHTRFGGSVCRNDRVTRSLRHAHLFRWVLTSARNVGPLLKKCRPYFIFKGEEADIA